MYKQIEDAIVEKLKQDLPNQVKVEAFPDAWDSSGKAFVRTLVLVGFNQDNLSEPNNAFACTLQQEGTLGFEINVLAKDLRSHQGIYTILEQIILSLSGFKPSIAELLRNQQIGFCYFTNLGFQAYDANAYWLWTIQLELPYKISTPCQC